MPSLEDYEALAPFSLPDLVEAANAILRERPTMRIQERTVRFYISKGLLPPPGGGPKFARYGMEHLRRIVAIRQWLDAGVTLEQAAQRIEEGEHGGETTTHSRIFSPKMPPSFTAPAPARAPTQAPREPQAGSVVRRIPLTRCSTLEVDSTVNLSSELDRVVEAIVALQNSL